MQILYILFIIAVPAGIIFLTQRYSWAEKIGTVALCYIIGLIVGNSGLIGTELTSLNTKISEGAIAVGLPMILFTSDISQWVRTASKALLSMFFAFVSIVIISVILYFIFIKLSIERPEELAALSIGVYTGGTPNLAAIKTALQVPETRFLLFVAFDTVLGAIYLLFMVSGAKKMYGRFLPPYKIEDNQEGKDLTLIHNENFAELMTKKGIIGSILSIFFAAGAVAAVLGITEVLSWTGSAAVIILLTACGIVFSLIPQVRRVRESYKIGMYLIYIFSFSVAAQASFKDIKWSDISIFIFIFIAVFGSQVIHFFLCRLKKIDIDTFLITSVSAVCSPPFVPMMAKTLGNPLIILSGMTTGIIGYAAGTYLGIATSYILKNYL